MNLQPRSESVTVQNEILKTTQGLVWKVSGLTLDGSAFGDGVVPAGTPVTLPADNTPAVPFEDPETEGDYTGTAYVTTHDVIVKEGSNPVVGAFEEAYLDKNKVNISDMFITVSNGRYKLR